MAQPLINSRAGIKVVWGVPKEIKPIIGLPSGKVRLRLRNTSVGRVFVHTTEGIHHFVILDNGETWGLMAQGRNQTITQKHDRNTVMCRTLEDAKRLSERLLQPKP